MAQWFHYYSLTADDVKIGLKTFCDVFPYVTVWAMHSYGEGVGGDVVNGDLLLVGSAEPHALDAARVTRALADARLGADLRSVGALDPLALASNYVADRAGALAYAGGAPIHTDDRPVLEFSAPKGIYPTDRNGEKPSYATIILGLDAAATDLLPPLVNVVPAHDASRADSARAMRDIGARMRSAGAFARATRIYAASLALDSTSTEAAVALGELEYQLGNTSRGVGMLFDVRRRHPEDADVLEKLIAMLMEQQDPRADAAIADYARLRPADAEGQYLLATVAARQRRFDDARALAEKAIALDPNREDAHRLLAELAQRR
jgi:tetratricopeptide (TPR) repeat protein